MHYLCHTIQHFCTSSHDHSHQVIIDRSLVHFSSQSRKSKLNCERARGLVVTTVSASLATWVPLLVGANILEFNSVGAFSGRRHSRRQRGACGDFGNLEDLSAQSPKMLIKVGFTFVCS